MRKEKARTCWRFSRTRRLRFHLPEVENAASRNSCNTLTSMATSLCRWRCSGGERVRKKKSDIIFSFILPATENANRYYIGCCLKTVFETQQTEATIYNKVETLYEDRELAVIYKPEGLLSVPGKDAAQPSVYALMRRKYQEATGPLIVHRLDMATSGLMIIAKTEFAYHRLQKEFLNHRVQKKYVAIVCGKDKESCNRILKEAESGRGYISLPLIADFLDRPRQMVNREQGKEAITEYEVLERIDDTHLRLALYPKTGRTHQLRVHCAHQEGLNAPIIGDPLYGNEPATRLHLHAEEITFEHPMTGKKMTITRKADF